MRYIELLGSVKPHLLTSIANNLGGTTTVTYAPSTKFYLADRATGRPWVTRLPFVVHVIECVEVFDALSRHRFVTTYAYHHGDYDGVEREMRGFGMVEQRDTESSSAFSGAGFADGGKAFLGGSAASTFVHGADLSRKAAFSIEVNVNVEGLKVEKTSTPNVPNATIIHADRLVPAQVNRLHVRARNEGGDFEVETIDGIDAIKSFVQSRRGK